MAKPVFPGEGMIMSRSQLLCISTMALCGILSSQAESALADDRPVKVEKEWKGGSDDQNDSEAWRHAPAENVIAGPKAWEKLWKAWRFEKKLPKVDFKKDLILVVGSEGPNAIRIDQLTLNEKGNLRFDWHHTCKLGPGYRYLILRVSRDGVKTVSGKEIPKDE